MGDKRIKPAEETQTDDSVEVSGINSRLEDSETRDSSEYLLYSSDKGYTSGNKLKDCSFQYVLAAATSITTKDNEETLTYLNQGQSYEIKMKKLGDSSAYRGKILKSTIRICFHERLQQYMEREQMLVWQRARPGKRLLEVVAELLDVPLRDGIVDVCQPSNSVDFMWDPTKEVVVFIKIHCIGTDFVDNSKIHGGKKRVPFKIQVETRFPGGPYLHAASCQVKIFKRNGADRRYTQDRDKMFRRPPHEQDLYQPSYASTVLSDIPLESLPSFSLLTQNDGSLYASTDAISPQTRAAIGGNSSPVVAPLALSISNSGIVPLVPASDAVKKNVGTASALPSPAAILLDQPCIEADVTSYFSELAPDASTTKTTAWLRANRFSELESIFKNFCGSDIWRLSQENLIQICGMANGIRLFNRLHVKALTPKLTLYFSSVSESNDSRWRVVYLESLTIITLKNKLLSTLNLSHDRLDSILFLGPQDIHVVVTDELVANMKDGSMYLVETIEDPASEHYKLLIKLTILNKDRQKVSHGPNVRDKTLTKEIKWLQKNAASFMHCTGGTRKSNRSPAGHK